VDPTDDCNKQTKNDKDRLKVLEYQLKTAKDEEVALRMFYESKIINQDEWLELERDLKFRYSVIDGSKKALINNITYNLKKGYGAFDTATDHGLKDNYTTSSKVLEALNSQNFKEDLFPYIPGETPNSSKVIAALKDSGKLTEDTFSDNTEAKHLKGVIERFIDKDKSNPSFDYNFIKKDSIGDIKGITGSDSETVSHSSNTYNETKRLENEHYRLINNKKSFTTNIIIKTTFLTG